MSSEGNKLPSGWATATVEEIGDQSEQVVLTGPFGTSLGPKDFQPDGVPVLTIGCLTGGRLDLSKARYISEEKASALDKYRLRSGDLLFSRMASVGKSCMVPAEHAESIFNYHLMRLRLADRVFLSPLFVHYVHGAPQVRAYLKEVNHGATRDGVNTTQLLGLPVVVPPLNEQKRIVAKIEALQERSEAAKEALDAIPPLLEKFRQSVLASAFRGDLTKAWRAQNPDVEPASKIVSRTPTPARPSRYKSRSKAIQPGVAALAVGNPGTPTPPGWAWVPLVDVARLESGHTPSRRHPEWWGGDVDWIGIPDAREHHGRTITETKQQTNPDGLANSAARLLPAGTVCLSRTASVGYVVVMGKDMATSQDFVNWTCTGAVEPEWLKYLFMAEERALWRFSKGTTHSTIYFPEVLSFNVCLPPVEEQRVIVRAVKERLAFAESVESAIEAATETWGGIGSSILAKAFRGELVPQDPNDEPASVLLERIRGQRREAAGPSGKGGPAKRRRKQRAATAGEATG